MDNEIEVFSSEEFSSIRILQQGDKSLFRGVGCLCRARAVEPQHGRRAARLARREPDCSAASTGSAERFLVEHGRTRGGDAP